MKTKQFSVCILGMLLKALLTSKIMASASSCVHCWLSAHLNVKLLRHFYKCVGLIQWEIYTQKQYNYCIYLRRHHLQTSAKRIISWFLVNAGSIGGPLWITPQKKPVAYNRLLIYLNSFQYWHNMLKIRHRLSFIHISQVDTV